MFYLHLKLKRNKAKGNNNKKEREKIQYKCREKFHDSKCHLCLYTNKS